MAVTTSYLIPVGDLSLEARLGIRAAVDVKLQEAAQRLKIRDHPDDMVIRDTLPLTDLTLAATDDWLIPGPGVAGTALQYFSSLLGIDRCVGFFGVGVETALASNSRLSLTQGAASAQIRGVYHLEQLNSRLEPAGYFSETIIFIRQETIRAMVIPRLAYAANTERMHLFARTIEPIGSVISAPSV